MVEASAGQNVRLWRYSRPGSPSGLCSRWRAAGRPMVAVLAAALAERAVLQLARAAPPRALDPVASRGQRRGVEHRIDDRGDRDDVGAARPRPLREGVGALVAGALADLAEAPVVRGV